MYPIQGREVEFDQRLQRAHQWLVETTTETLQEKVLQLVGLHISGASDDLLHTKAKDIRRMQREDGGWAQLPGLPSDAWMTGLTLVALDHCDQVQTGDEVYRRGLQFLLNTEFEDGSWFVQRRAWPMQPLFDSQFPHGKDQWISAAATTFATMAMLRAVETFDDTLIKNQNTETNIENIEVSSTTQVEVPMSFDSTIKPLLERSCTGCHGGARPKARLRFNTVEALRAGGESGASTIVPGKPQDSPLYRFPAGLVEDMEMPPLHKREDYPPLTKSELDQIRQWIVSGAE